MSEHTPTPWEVIETKNEGDYGDGPDPSSGFDSFAVCDAEGRVICDTLNTDTNLSTIVEDDSADEDGHVHAWDEVGKANASHIVRCVNAHDVLVKVISDAVMIIDTGGASVALWNHMVTNARAALAKVSA